MAKAAEMPFGPQSHTDVAVSNPSATDDPLSSEYIRIRYNLREDEEDSWASECSVLKSTLINESEFFKAMFRNPYVESELGQVDLPDDDPKALALVLACLQGLPDRPVWYLLDFWLEVAVEALLSTHPSKDNWATIEEALEVYFIADKYGIQSIRDGLADWGLSALLEIHFEFRFGRAATVDDFLEHFFKPVRDRLGRFPRELHGHYINAINHFLHTKEDLEKLIKTTKDDPLLTASLVLPLAKNLAESREESRRLKRKLKRKSYQLATVSSYGRGVAIREAADCGLCWNDLNDELNQKDSKVWDDCDGDDYMEYSDMSDS